MSTDILDPRLAPAHQTVPAHHWEGPFEPTFGATAEANFHVRAQLHIGGDLMEGGGEATLDEEGARHMPITLTGTRAGSSLHFELWIEDAEFGKTPLTCTGAFGLDEDTIGGDWTYPCMDPEGCNCQGGGGRFTLHRVTTP